MMLNLTKFVKQSARNRLHDLLFFNSQGFEFKSKFIYRTQFDIRSLKILTIRYYF